MKFLRDKLAGVRNVHSKFQVSRTSGNLFLYCKILHVIVCIFVAAKIKKVQKIAIAILQYFTV